MDAFYTIPTIDLSDNRAIQTLVDREDGVYLGHPTTVLLDDGQTLVTVYPKNHGLGQIVLKKSFDGGKSWSERLPVPDSWSTSLEVPTLFKLTDKNNVQRLVMFSGLYPIRMSVSCDEGSTWSELASIGDYGGVVAMSTMLETAPGEYLAFFHDDGRFIHGGESIQMEIYRAGEGRDVRTKAEYREIVDGKCGEAYKNWVPTLERDGDIWEKIYTSRRGKEYADGHFVLYCVKSTDGGLTWSEPRAICSHTGGAQLCEPCAVRAPDDGKIAVIMRENSRKFNSFLITSDDNGKTWSAPVELPAALTGDRHTAKYLNDGRLFISFRDMTRESQTKGDWVAWVGTFDDIINLREGQCRVRIMKNYKNADCAYPGVEVLPDGTVVTTTYGHFTPGEQAYIMCVRITPELLTPPTSGEMGI